MKGFMCAICRRYFDEADIIYDVKGNTLCSFCNDNNAWSWEFNKYIEGE